MRTPSKSDVYFDVFLLIRLNCTYTFVAIDTLCLFVYKICLYKFRKGN